MRQPPASREIVLAERLAIYLEVAARLRATGERGSEVAALLVEQLADELGDESGAPADL